MKTPHDIVGEISRRLERTWATHLTGETAWPHRFSVSLTDKSTLEAGWQNTYQPRNAEWTHWARQHPAELHREPRRIYTTTQNLPVGVTIATIYDAAAIVGGSVPAHIDTARDRLNQLTARFPHTTTAGILRTAARYDAVDFDLLLTVADWFTHQQPEGLTPRQVPIPGVHTKWLKGHSNEVAALAGRDTLGLLPPHPPRIHFTYLDPEHRATGGRVHDSATVGDTFQPAYAPQIVVISENKDTAIHFPPIAGGIAVEGDGFGGSTAAAFPWITNAPGLYYWGDIDSHGFEILNGFRQAGVPVTSILMDTNTYDAYEPFGTNLGADNKPIPAGAHKPLEHLTPTETALYNRLTDPTSPGHRRIEQERIPLAVAGGAVREDPALGRTVSD